MGAEVEASEGGATTMASSPAGGEPRRRMDPDLVGTEPPCIPQARPGARQPGSQVGGGVVYWEGGRGGFHFLDPEHGDIFSDDTASGEGRRRLPTNTSADRATNAAARRRSTHSASPQVRPPPSPSSLSLFPSPVSLSLSLFVSSQQKLRQRWRKRGDAAATREVLMERPGGQKWFELWIHSHIIECQIPSHSW
jgi:hypothetical protein